MKKIVRTIALVLTLTVMAAFLFDGSNAASLGGLNSDTAVAGASLKLESFFANNEDAGKLIASFFEIPEETTEDETEILEAELVMYEEAKTGYCSAKDLLNVRSDSDKSGTVLAVLGRGDEIELLGEITKVSEDGKETVWYAVSANGHQGFISGDYVKFGDEGKAIYDEMHVASAGKMPEKFVVPDDVAALPEEVRAALKSNVGEINWCQNFYQTKAAEEDYTGMYSTLLYISELYRRVIKTSNEYSLLRTGRKATDAHNLVATELGRLSAITNKTAEDFYIDIQMQNEEYRKKKAEEEAAKAAALAAEEAAKKAAAEKAAAEAAANQAAAEAAA